MVSSPFLTIKRKNMKFKYFRIAAFLCIVLTVFSCGKKEKKTPALGSEYLRPATMQYSKQDTAEINQIVNQYVELLGSRNFEDAANMLYTVRNDSIIPFDEETKKGFCKAYSQFPIYAVKVTSLVLRSDKNNQVDVSMQITQDGDISTNKGVTTMSLNPVVKNGKWYLTLLSKNAEGVQDVYDPNNSSY